MVQGRFSKGKITCWLLPVVLVLSFLSFSGVSSPTLAKSRKPATEQIDPVRVSKRKIASVKFFGDIHSPLETDQTSVTKHQLLNKNRAVEILFDHCSGQCLSFSVLDRVFQRSLPSSDEEILTILPG